MSGKVAGTVVSYKQFTADAIKTQLRFLVDPTATEITQADLAMIMEGAAYSIQRRVADYEPTRHLVTVAASA